MPAQQAAEPILAYQIVARGAYYPFVSNPRVDQLAVSERERQPQGEAAHPVS
jgi:hypothetical protein